MKRSLLFITVSFFCLADTNAQKVLHKAIKHVEPLQLDLVQDLNASKGDKQVEFDLDATGQLYYDEFNLALEYEHALSERSGIKVRIPVSIYHIKPNDAPTEERPRNRIESLKIGFQYMLAVVPSIKTSIAAAFIHEFHFHSFKSIKEKGTLTKGLSETAALIIARRWGRRFHSMLYTGPQWKINPHDINRLWLPADLSIHYQLTKRAFAGIEYACKDLIRSEAELFPQVRIGLNKWLDLGLAASIPYNRKMERINLLASIEVKL